MKVRTSKEIAIFVDEMNRSDPDRTIFVSILETIDDELRIRFDELMISFNELRISFDELKMR